MVKQEQYLIRKNLLVLCAAFLLNSTAFHCMQNLQSSINTKGGLGLVGLAVIYFAVVSIPIYKLCKSSRVVELETCMQVVVGSNPAQTKLASTILRHNAGVIFVL